MGLKSIKKNERAALQQQTQFIRFGLTFFFMAGILLYVYLISKGMHGHEYRRK
jgi:hypothetical protein